MSNKIDEYMKDVVDDTNISDDKKALDIVRTPTRTLMVTSKNGGAMTSHPNSRCSSAFDQQYVISLPAHKLSNLEYLTG